MSRQQAELLLEALSKKYEKRTYQEHKAIHNAIFPFFPTLTPKRVRLLTFFLQLKLPPSEIYPENHTPNSTLLVVSSTANPELPWLSMHKLNKNAISIPAGGFGIVLDYEKYLNADRLGETSIEKEISFWESSEYFCSMPKIKFYELIRLAKVMVLAEGQCAYVQGQLITEKQSGSGIFVVRKGEFGCFREEIEASHFDSGHMFGALQVMGESRAKERVTTVRCKTSEAIVYQISQTIFNQFMRSYCENVVRSKQAKLLKFLPPQQHMEKSKSISFSHTLTTKQSKIMHSDTAYSLPFRSASTQVERELEEKEMRAFPALRLQKIRQTATTSFYKSTLRESERIEAQGLRRSTYLSLKQDGPLKNYPLPAQRSNFPSSEFRELDKLLGQQKGQQQVGVGRSGRGVWKRDMISSFYRESIYGSLRRQVG